MHYFRFLESIRTSEVLSQNSFWIYCFRSYAQDFVGLKLDVTFGFTSGDLIDTYLPMFELE